MSLAGERAMALADAVANPHPPIVQGSVESLSGQAVAVDAAGNRYVAGNFNQTLDFNPYVGIDAKTGPAMSSMFFAFVTRFNANGSYAWTQTFGGTGNTFASALILSADGSTVYLSGSFNCTDAQVGSAGVTVSTNGNFDGYVLALNAATGAPVTTFGLPAAGVQVLGGTGSDGCAGLALSGSTLYVAGDFDSSDFNIGGNATTVAAGISSADAFVAALDAGSGQYVGTFGITNTGVQTFGGTGFCHGIGVSVSGSTLFLCGNFTSPDAQVGFAGPTTPSSGNDAFVLALDVATGAAITTFGGRSTGVQTFGGAGGCSATSIVSSATAVYVGGYFNAASAAVGSSPSVPYNPSIVDAYVMGLDAATGAVLPNFGFAGTGVQTLGGSGTTQGFSLALSGSTLYFSGQANNSDTQIGGAGAPVVLGPVAIVQARASRSSIRSIATIGDDAFVMAIDPSSGAAKPAFAAGVGIVTYGGSGTEVGYGMALKGNTLYVGGETDSTDTYVNGAGPFNSTGFASFLIPFDATTGVFNLPPTALMISNNTVPETVPPGSSVGDFSTTDPNAGNTFTYALVPGVGGTDNAAFMISGTTLLSATPFNFPVQNSYSIRVRSTDQGGEFIEGVFVISITEVNSPPMDIQLSKTTILENSPLGTTVGALTSSDPDPGSTFTYALVPGVGSTDNAAFAISGSILVSNKLFNFPVQSSYSVRIQTSDPRGLTFQKVFVITVIEVNSAPTDIALSNASIPASSPLGTLVGALTSTDPDPGSTFTYSLVPGTGGTDNTLFAIAGTNLKTNALFASSTQSSFSVRIRSADPRGLFFEKAFTITLTGVNHAPTDIALSNSALLATSPVGTTVGALSSTDPDAGNTFVYTLAPGAGATDNNLFAIAGSNLNTAALINPGAQTTFNVRIRSTDQGGLFVEKAFVISVIVVNGPLADFTISSNTILANSPVGTLIGAFSASGGNPSATYTYTLVPGAGGDDNALFAISAGSLYSNALYDFNTQNDFSVRVRSTDSSGMFIEKAFEITLTAVSSGIINVSNETGGVDSVTNPDSGVGITVASSSGGVITLKIDIDDAKKRRNASATSDWGDIDGRSSVTKGLSPRHQYIKHGIYVVTTTVIDPVTGELIGKMRKTLAISAHETGEPPPSAVSTETGKKRAKEGRTTATEAPSNVITTKVAKGRFIFSGKGRDTVTYTGRIKLPKGLDTSLPIEFSIGIGNVVATATINPRGGGIAGEAEGLPQDGVLRYLKIAYGVLKSPIAKGGENATLTAVFAASALTTSGFDTEGISVRSAQALGGRSAPRSIQIAMVLDGVTYEALAPVSFSASSDSEFGAIKSRN